jgi:hypothetical protein
MDANRGYSCSYSLAMRSTQRALQGGSVPKT